MESAQDVIALLKKDHADVKRLFKQFERSESAKEKNALAARICEMLTVHSTCEDEFLYPAARHEFDDVDRELVNEASVGHATAKDLIGQLEMMSAGDERFAATMQVLGEYVNHHVEEEEGEIFPRLRTSDLDLKELGQQFTERKEQLTHLYERQVRGPVRTGPWVSGRVRYYNPIRHPKGPAPCLAAPPLARSLKTQTGR
jgi:hemerythrin-like domain-containing protein